MKNLTMRVERLERRIEKLLCPTICIWVTHRIDSERRNALAPGERIVEDWYRWRGQWVEARERISTDPTDEGWRCEKGGVLVEVIRNLHKECQLRGTGVCGICGNLNLDVRGDLDLVRHVDNGSLETDP